MTTQLSLPRARIVPILIGALVVAGGWLIRAQDETRSGEWRSSGGDSAYRRYSPLAQITRDNVKNLRIVWRRPALDPSIKEAFPKLRTNNYLRATPTMIGGVLYTPDKAHAEYVSGWGLDEVAARLRRSRGGTRGRAACWR